MQCDANIDLSIIIPCYNNEKYIDECVASICLESHPEIDLVLVDDGSTDSTPAICDRLAAEYSQILVLHRENGGAASARNAGLMLADGDWVWFVDSDDIVSPYAIDLLLSLSKKSQADAIQFNLIPFFSNEPVNWQLPSDIKLNEMTAPEFAKALHACSRQHYACSFLFRRRGQVRNLFLEGYSLFEDAVSIEHFIGGATQIDVVDATLYGYRQVSSSMSHKRCDSSADSALRAVRAISLMPVAVDDFDSRSCMEISLLFTAYRVAGKYSSLKREIRNEIESRVESVGFLKLGISRLVRYLLLRCGVMDLIIDWREHARK